MRKQLVIGILSAIILTVLACSKDQDRAVARIGEDFITISMIKDQYLAISPQARPDLPTIDEKERFARDVVSKEILRLEAEKMGLDKAPEAAEARYSTMRREAWRLFYEENVRSKVEIDEEELRDYYARQGENYHLVWIFVRSGDLARRIMERLRSGEDFSELAGLYSLDASREKGGDIGTRALITMPQVIEDAILKLEPGELGGPIKYGTYYLIVRMEGKEPREVADFETARTGLESIIRARKEGVIQRELAGKLMEDYGLTFVDDTIDMIVQKTNRIYTSETMPPGEVPEFSDEEMARTVAKFGGAEWKVMNYVQKVSSSQPFMRPGYGTDAETVKGILTDAITGELWIMEIKKQGYEERPEVLAAARRAQEEAVVTALHDEIVKHAKLDEDTLRKFYDERKEELVTQAGAELAVIMLETEDQAKEVHAELEAGREFEGLAKERSIDQMTAERGGRLFAPIYQGQLDQLPDLAEVVEDLRVETYSEPVPVPPGFGPGEYMIVKVLNKTESRQLTYDEVKQELSGDALRYEQDRVFGDWLSEKLVEYQVEIYPDELASIDFARLKESGN
jgi:parvulin-like peptidyl-prolyl isomerase